jgi:xanthine dehydrogenase YagR molybdenum-binding subunit
MQPADVRVLSPFVGGAFGVGLRPQYQLFLAVMAARQLKRSVKVTLTRQQMFTLGCRPQTIQRVQLGAARNGRLRAVSHQAIAATSRFEDYTEPVVNWSGELYSCRNVMSRHDVAELDLNTPCDMRAPGATWGVFALESAMDELAYKLQIDPLELRLKNFAEKKDLNTGMKFSSNALGECYRQGAERFGWSSRVAAPRSMRDGETLIGWGLATGVWHAIQFPASARAVLTADGKLRVGSGTEDIGTGTYTIMTQIAADALGLPIEDVTFELGDSTLPPAPVQGGSFTAASVGSAVKAACDKVCKKVFNAARKVKDSPLSGARLSEVTFRDSRITLNSDPSRSVSILDAMRLAKNSRIEEVASAKPGAKAQRHIRHSHSAVFAEVRVDPDLGSIEVSRMVSAIAAGRILNPKTARSQIMGAIVMGVGMALQEESVIDHKFGRFMNHSFGEYHVPVHADIPDIDVIFVEEKDSIVNPLGVKGLGELGIVGTAAAIANAVFHATGQRIRTLPITLDKLLAATAAEEPEVRRPAA